MKEWLNHKAVRITAAILLGLMGLYLLLLVALQLYVSADKEKLLVQINSKLGNALQGKVNLQNIRINVWAHFPQVEVNLENFTVTDTVYNRPLVNIEKIYTLVSLTDVLGRRINVRAVTLSNGFIHLSTDSTGRSNRYALHPRHRDTTAAGRKTVFVKEVTLDNITAISENALKQKHFEILFQHAVAQLHKLDTVIDIRLREKALVKGLGFNLPKGQYLDNKPVEGRLDLHINTASQSIRFSRTKLAIDNHPFELEGAFVLDSAQSHFRLHIQTQKINYQQAARLLTKNIQRKLLLVDLSQPVNVEAQIEGSLASGTIPLVNVHWSTEKSTLTTPAAVFTDCSFSGSFRNEDTVGHARTDANSVIVLHQFTGNWGGIWLKGNNTVISNLIQPNLQFDFSSSCDFPALDDKLGLRTLHFEQGKAQLELRYNGPLVTDASAMDNISGRLAVQDGVVHYEPRDITFTHCNGEVFFSENDLAIKNLECNVGSSKFQVVLQGNDVGRLASSDSVKASIICSLFSDSLNLADFKNLFARPVPNSRRKNHPAKFAKTAIRMDNLLEKGSLQLNLKANAIRLQHFTASALTGSILFQHNSWQIQNVAVQHAGGDIFLKGNVRQTGNARHILSVNTKLQRVDVRRLFYAFNNFGLDGLGYQNLQGKLDMTASISLGVDSRSNLIPNSVNGNIFFSLKDGALINYQPIQRIQQYVFKDRDLHNIQFAELTDSLIIKEDEITIKRMEVQSSVMNLYVEGLYSRKGNTDISIQVPLSNFVVQKDKDEKPRNRGVDRKVGPSVYLRAKTDLKGNLKVGLDLFKKFRKKDKEKNKPAG